jgi:hypothetical protein
MTSPNKQIFNWAGLPTELQDKIMDLTYLPQIIVIKFSIQTHDLEEIPRVLTHTPIALHINRATREEAQKHYELLEYEGMRNRWYETGLYETFHGVGYTQFPRIYMNFQTDRIEFIPERAGNALTGSVGEYDLDHRILSQTNFINHLSPDQIKRISSIYRDLSMVEILEKMNMFRSISSLEYDPVKTNKGNSTYHIKGSYRS